MSIADKVFELATDDMFFIGSVYDHLYRGLDGVAEVVKREFIAIAVARVFSEVEGR